MVAGAEGSVSDRVTGKPTFRSPAPDGAIEFHPKIACDSAQRFYRPCRGWIDGLDQNPGAWSRSDLHTALPSTMPPALLILDTCRCVIDALLPLLDEILTNSATRACSLPYALANDLGGDFDFDLVGIYSLGLRGGLRCGDPWSEDHRWLRR